MKQKTLALVCGGVCLVSLAACTPFARNILTYQEPGIEDHQIFPSQVVKRGEPQPWKIAKNYNQTNLEPAQEKKFTDLGTVAYLVAQNGEVVFEHYWEGHTVKSYSASFSMAKSIVSLLVGIALGEGKLKSLDQPIGDYLPSFRVADKSKITFRHLLTMTSGLDWEESYTSITSPTAQLYYGDDLLALVSSLKVKSSPGEVWYYSSADTQILGMALEAAIGMRLSEYASQKIWQPIGAEFDASWSMDKDNGTIKGNCCFNSTPRDFLRLGQLVLHQGQWANKTVVPRPYLELATKPNPNLYDAQKNPVNFYGFQFWLGQLQQKPVTAFLGHLGQYIFVIPHLNAVVMRLGNRELEDGSDIQFYQQFAVGLLEKNR